MIQLTSQQIERLKRLVSKPFETVTDIKQTEHSLDFHIKYKVLLYTTPPVDRRGGFTTSRKEVTRYILENIDEVDTRSVISWLESERKDLVDYQVQKATRNIYSTGIDESKKRINQALEKVLEHLTIRDVNQLKNRVFVQAEIDIQWSESYLDALGRDIKLCKETRDKILNDENELKLRVMFDIDSIRDESIRYAAYAHRRDIGEELLWSITEFEERYDDEIYERIDYLDQLYDLVPDALDFQSQIGQILSSMNVKHRIYECGITIDDLLDENVIVFEIFTLDQFDLDKFEQSVYELEHVTSVHITARQKDLSIENLLRKLGFY